LNNECDIYLEIFRYRINTRVWLTELSRALAVPRLRDEGRVASQDNPIGRTLWPVS
jgi:hypothetical protein